MKALYLILGGKKVWLFGIIDNIKKDFGLEASFKRDETTIKAFISKFVEKGNTICTDGWQAYSFLGNPHSGYIHITHVHSSGNFGLDIASTSYKESIWAQIKGNIKRTYNVIPNKNFMSLVREQECKLKIKNLGKDGKIKYFFDSYKIINNVEDNALMETDDLFLPDSPENAIGI